MSCETTKKTPRSLPAHLVSVLTGAGLRVLLQPVVHLRTGTVVGYESLARGPAGSSIETAPALLAAAESAGCRRLVEGLCVEKAFEAKRRFLGSGLLLFVNVSPSAMDWEQPLDGPASSGTEGLGIADGKVVIEISEQTAIRDEEAFYERIAACRRQGYRFALDDMGAGYAGLRMLLDLRPDFVKLDRSLVCEIDGDERRVALIESIVAYCRRVGARTVAEGIETAAQLKALLKIGVELGQGYFLGLPAERPRAPRPEALAILRDGPPVLDAGLRDLGAGR